MSGLAGKWQAISGAVVALFSVGVSSGPARAAEPDVELAASSITVADDATGSLELESPDSDTLPLAQRYAPAPPPPRSSYRPSSGYRPSYGYRPYAPHWGFRILPPPIFAPSWFGLYFWGAPPPPPQGGAPVPVSRPDFRHVNEYSFSVTAGANLGQYGANNYYQKYTDPGLRFALDYRRAPVLGAQLSVGFYGSNMRFDNYGTAARMDVPIQLSAVLHAFPRSPIQPYFLFGGTGNIRTYQYVNSDHSIGDSYSEFRVGPHAGLGLELLVGDRISMVVEGRSVWYTLVDRSVADQTRLHDRSVTGGLNFYF